MRRSPLVGSLLLSAVLLGTVQAETPAVQDAKPIRALLVIGGCCHDYKNQKELLTKGISARANVSWTIAYDPDTTTRHLNPIFESDDWAKGYDVIVHDECSADVKDSATIEKILKPHKAGLPGVVLHCGMHSFRGEGYPKTTAWFEFTGCPSTGHGPQAPIDLAFIDAESPITKGMKNWTTVNEELYNNSAGNLLETAQPLVKGKQSFKNKNGKESSNEFVVAWTNTYNGKAKVFATTLGHNNATVSDDRYLDLVARGLLWSVGKLDETHLKPAAKVLLEDTKK